MRTYTRNIDDRIYEQDFTIEVSTEPAAEVITRAAYQNVYSKLDTDITTDNDIIDIMLVAARKACETYCKRAFINQSWKMTFETQMPGAFYLPGGKVQSVTSIKVYTTDADATGTAQTSTWYQVKTGENGMVWLRDGSSWTNSQRSFNALEVIYVVGFGAAGSNVPDEIRNAIMITAQDYYDNREGRQKGAMTIPPAAKTLLDPWKVRRI